MHHRFGQTFAACGALCIASTCTAQERPAAVIPIELYHNRVYLPVRVNGSLPYTMILDTGAAETFVSDPVANATKLLRKGSAQVNGNGEGVARFALAKNVSFSVGTAELLEKTVVIYSYDDFERHEGRIVDGTLGVNFFHKYVVKIDYAAQRLSVYDPDTFSYSGGGSVIPLRILNGGTLALFDARIDAGSAAPVYAHLAVDSGTYSALRLFRPFVDKHGFVLDRRNQFASFGFGAGGEFQQVTGRVQGLELGNLRISGPAADFSRDSKGVTATTSYDGTIGGDILRRFTVILDYSRQQMILEPNAYFNEPFDENTSGMILWASGKDFAEIRVGHVAEKSAAAEAGMREGDAVMAVDNKVAAELGLENIRKVLLQRGNHTVVVRRDEQTRKIEIRDIPAL